MGSPRQPEERLIPDALRDDLKQEFLVDVEKEAADIELQGITGLRPVVRHAPHVLLKALHRPVRPLARTAGIGVMEKDRLPDAFQDIHQHMMDDSVAEIRRENFPELGLLDDETDRTGGMVGRRRTRSVGRAARQSVRACVW